MTTHIKKTTAFHDAIKPECDQLRADIKAIEQRVREMRGRNDTQLPYLTCYDLPEVIKNFELTISHLEDAAMRIGKVLQHASNGVSILDQPKGDR
jgi:hypothetical protein